MAQTASGVHDAREPTEVNESAVIKFINRELELLDTRRFEEWAELFTEDGVYWAPIGPDQADPKEHVSLFYDDRKTMRTRIAPLRHPQIHVQTPPSRTVHLVSNFQIAPDASGGQLNVKCNFVLFEYRPYKGQNVYGGTYEYALARASDGDYRIKQKKAAIVSSEDSFASLAIWF